LIKLVGLITLLLLVLEAKAKDYSELELKKMIAHMLVLGFDAKSIDKRSDTYYYIKKYEIGGVILFDRDYHDRKRTKNIESPTQLKKLTSQLQAISTRPLLISVDQEGGKVARLKSSYGFTKTPSAAKIGSKSDAKTAYTALAKELNQNGINCNFAPVVDLSVNRDNFVIYKLERSYGESAQKVADYAKIFMDSLHDNGIVSVLKHFPGHGSSLGDSHAGFVDVSDTWSKKELEPYKKLIKSGSVDMIMTAHVFNKNLDEKYPATLSYNTNTKLLREELGYDGLIISDDMQMKAISKQFSLKDTVTLAINSSVDILLFGNQLAYQDTGELIEVIYKQVKSGAIPLSRIIESNRRIDLLHVNSLKPLKIIDRPIDFTPKRIEMSKAYIKEHYGLHVKNIEIDPKIIVLHWTAIMDLNKSYHRLKGDTLYTDRKDIANASLLNVSAHFLVDRDGTIYRLMKENSMARHVIGLNYSSIGIENIGGEGNVKEDLTPAQLEANIALVRYLKRKFPKIEYLIGHHEYRDMESTSLWLEKDSGYRTEKADPGDKFMRDVRKEVRDLKLRTAPVN